MAESHPAQRMLIMGILNVTPDSFSDGGEHIPDGTGTGAHGSATHASAWTPDVEAPDVEGPDAAHPAMAHARRMVDQGADIIDIGGESTRPGADPVAPAQEQRRILPVLEQLLNQGPDAQLSIDTRHPQTARAALELAGEQAPGLIINDVSGLLTHPEMPAVIADYGCEVVLTHNRGDAKTMQHRTQYDDVVAEVTEELRQIRQPYLAAGVPQESIILDPGIGFAKTHEQNWELIRHLDSLTGLGHRLLVGASRKGFLKALLGQSSDRAPTIERRDTLTAVLSAHAAAAGCWAVRVHAVTPNADAVALAAQLA